MLGSIWACSYKIQNGRARNVVSSYVIPYIQVPRSGSKRYSKYLLNSRGTFYELLQSKSGTRVYIYVNRTLHNIAGSKNSSTEGKNYLIENSNVNYNCFSRRLYIACILVARLL